MNIGKLIPYELSKYLNRFHLILLSVLFILTIGLTVLFFREYFTSDYREFQSKKDELITLYTKDRDEYNRISSEHTARVDEYYAALISNSGVSSTKSFPVFENHYIDLEKYGDRDLFLAVEKVVFTPISYKERMSSVLRDAVFRLKEANEGTYIEQYYLEFCLNYLMIADLELAPEEVRGWNEYFSFQLPSVMLVIALVGTLCTIFTEDRRVGMENILHISKYGGKSNIGAKLFFIGIISSVITIVFTAAPLLILSLTSGLSSLNHPIQMVDALMYCPVKLTIGQYLVLYFVLRIFIFTVFSLLVAVVNQFFENDKFAFVTAAILVISGVFLSAIEPASTYYFLAKFSITELAGINILFEKYRGLNIFGHCVDYLSFMLIVVLFVTIFLITVSLIHKYDRVLEYSNNVYSFGRSSHTMSLFFAETYKQLICARFILLIVGALALKIVISGIYYYPTDNHGEKQYRSYIQMVAGDITDEKLSMIEQEARYIETSLSEYNIASARYHAGEMDEEEFEEYKERKNYAEYNQTGCERLCERRDYLLSISQVYPDVKFVYDEGLDRYFGSHMDIVAIFLIVYMASNMFSCEYETGFNGILRVTKKGRKTLFYSKLFYSVFIVIILYLLFGLIEAGFIGYYYDTDYWSAPIQSMPRFENIINEFTVAEYFVSHKIVSLTGYVCSFMLVLAFSAIMQSQIKAIITSLFIMLISYVISQTSILPVAVLNYIEIITPRNIESMFVSIISCMIVSMICVGFVYKKWCGQESRI